MLLWWDVEQPQSTIVEVAYNLLDACKRYSYDADIELFQKVMNGTLDDDVYDDQMVSGKSAVSSQNDQRKNSQH